MFGWWSMLIMRLLIVFSMLHLFFFAQQNAKAQQIEIDLHQVSILRFEETPEQDWPPSIPRAIPIALEQVIKISFSTEADLRQLVRDEHIAISATSVVCGKEAEFAENDDSLSSFIADEFGLLITGLGPTNSRKNNVGKDSTLQYHAYLSPISLPNILITNDLHYNLLERAEPICFHLTGDKIWKGTVLTSNVLRIESSQITAAVKSKN
jgi:hypothetical protein